MRQFIEAQRVGLLLESSQHVVASVEVRAALVVEDHRAGRPESDSDIVVGLRAIFALGPTADRRGEQFLGLLGNRLPHGLFAFDLRGEIDEELDAARAIGVKFRIDLFGGGREELQLRVAALARPDGRERPAARGEERLRGPKARRFVDQHSQLAATRLVLFPCRLVLSH